MRLFLQILLTLCALVLGFWISTPWPSLVGMGALALASTWVTRQGRIGCAESALIWGGTLMVGSNPLWTNTHNYILDPYSVLLAWLIAVIVFVASDQVADPSTKSQWRILATGWMILGGFIWVVLCYLQNLSLGFHVGLMVNLVILFLFKRHVPLKSPVIQIINTLILCLIGLPTVDFFIRLTPAGEAHPTPSQRYYSYEVATRDPKGHAAWQTYIGDQWGQVLSNLFIPDRDGKLMWRLKPNAQHKFCDSLITINRKGFRGKDFLPEKGNAYRIIVLGESSTFGITLNPTDTPWPELLEQHIRERLKPSRRVEVINAGVPSYTLEDNLYRLPGDILPLKPDMIITYHGYNGFHLIDDSLPLSYSADAPHHNERPLKILASAEFGLRVLIFKRKLREKLTFSPSAVATTMQTPFAKAYRQLIGAAETNRVRLVLANFSMAVNRQSDPAVIAFYRPSFPVVNEQLRANEIHSLIIRQLSQEYPNICVVDTHPHLDGDHNKFIDLVHFAHAGERQLAETIFAGIRKTLATELGSASEKSAALEAGDQ